MISKTKTKENNAKSGWATGPHGPHGSAATGVRLCKTAKRKDQLYIVYFFLYGESSVKISTQTDSY